MAERRMFAKNVIDSDLFLEMPLSTQALYFHLAMRADDDGFVNNPKKISRMIGADEESLRILISKSFLIPFDTGIVVIRHWKIHNYIRKDTYKSTAYKAEKAALIVDESNKYATISETVTAPLQPCDESVDGSLTQVRLGKVRLGKDSIDIDGEPSENSVRHKYGEFKHVLLTDSEHQKLCEEYGEAATKKYIKAVDEYCEMKGKTYKNYNLTVRNFMNRDGVQKKQQIDPNVDTLSGGRLDF